MQDEINKLLTVEEAAETLALTPRTIHRLCREGRLGCVQVTPKERRFTREQLAAYVEAQTIAPKNVIDTRAKTSLPLKAKGGERRDQRVLKVSEAGLLKQEIKRLCQ